MNAAEPSFFSRSDGSPAQWRNEMLATLRHLSRTFSNPSSVITVEPQATGADCEESIENWRQNSSGEREEEEVGAEPTPNAPSKLSPSRSLDTARPARSVKGLDSGSGQGRVHVGNAQAAQMASPNVRDLCSEEKAWRQLEAEQLQLPRMTAVYQRSFGPVPNPAPEASVGARQARSAVWSAAHGQGFTRLYDFGTPMPWLHHLPRPGAFSGKRAEEAAQDYPEGRRPQEYVEGKRPQEYVEGKRPQEELTRERTASGVEQSHDADSKFERTADVWEFADAKAGMRGHPAPPRLQHAQSVDSFFAHSETGPYGRGAADSSTKVQEPGLYSGGPARARYPLGRAAKASLGVKDQSLAFAESYRSEEPVHMYRRSRPRPKRRAYPEKGPRAPPGRFLLPGSVSLPREARSQPLSTGDIMYQRDRFVGGEVASESQEGAAGRNIPGHGALGNRFSVPPPLSLEEEMRSVRGGKRLLETPREGKKG
jgi:hypothetical protein